MRRNAMTHEQRLAEGLTELGLERAGVGLVLSRKLNAALVEIAPVNSRLMWAKFEASIPTVCVVTYAPPAPRPEDAKIRFYDQLGHITEGHKRSRLLLLGDWNARIVGRFEDEEASIGPQWFGVNQGRATGTIPGGGTGQGHVGRIL